MQLFAVFRGDFLSKKSREHAIHILLKQRFTSMIPAGLPSHATVAHKTGEISTVCHDAGIVYLPEREPYILAILTEVERETNGRRETVAKISEAIYGMITTKAGEKMSEPGSGSRRWPEALGQAPRVPRPGEREDENGIRIACRASFTPSRAGARARKPLSAFQARRTDDGRLPRG